MRLSTLVFLLIFIALGQDSFAAKNFGFCADLLSSLNGRPLQTRASKETSLPNGTDGFIVYLGTLLENQIIGDSEVSRLIDNLHKGMVENPITEEDTQISSSLYIHREGLEEYIRDTQIDQGKLLDWAEKSLKEKGRVRVKREETKVETQDVHHKMEFNKVEPGHFKMGEGNQKVKVTLTKPFEMMSAPVTQMQWSMIMEENPSRFVDGEHTIVMSIQGKQIMMQPDNPVEQVSWKDVQKYIAKLNKLSRKDDQRLYQLIPGHQKGDQYRLPTEAEWEYVVRDRGRANGTYHFGDNEADLKDHGWYDANSGNMTHPVAQLKPLIVDGKEFYDMHGNVWEWVQDWYGNLASGKKVTDPAGATSGSGRVIRGGSWGDDAQGLRSAYRGNLSPGNRGYDLGFRLVRTK